MCGSPGTQTSRHRSSVASGVAVRVGAVVGAIVLQAAILFLASGRLGWTWAWVYLGTVIVGAAIGGAFTLRTNPEAVAERARWPLRTKDWDKIVAGLYLLFATFLLPLVAGLDVRFGWTRELDAAWNLSGAMVLAVGLALTEWALIVNSYFSTAVRIQGDRGQTVCRAGPYRFVRHPGYVGYSLQSLGTALLLGSLWALIASAAAVALMVARTVLEDRLLQAELPGYPDYARDVRYRLVPGVW